MRICPLIFAETIPQPVDNLMLMAWLGFLSILALMMVSRMIAGIRREGVRTRPDLLEITDVLVASVVMVFYAILLAGRITSGDASPAEPVKLDQKQLIASITNLLVFPAAIILLMIARDMRPVDVFGLAKVGFGRACVLGGGLGLMALPLTTAVKLVTLQVTGSTEAPQQLVQAFSNAANGGAWNTIGLIALSAIVVAPFSEEIVFRGYIYPVLGRWFGRVIAAVIAAVFFGAIHDTRVDIPGLTVLALCFTIAYERTGSLLVPFIGHATFNGVSLLALWYQARHGIPL